MKRYDIEQCDNCWDYGQPYETEFGDWVYYEDIKDFIESVKIYVENYNKYGDACITILQDALRDLEK